MAEHLDRGPPHHDFVNVRVESEIDYWTDRWKVSREALVAAVQKAGIMAADVAKELGKDYPSTKSA